jgi:hypothetical protein
MRCQKEKEDIERQNQNFHGIYGKGAIHFLSFNSCRPIMVMISITSEFILK